NRAKPRRRSREPKADSSEEALALSNQQVQHLKRDRNDNSTRGRAPMRKHRRGPNRSPPARRQVNHGCSSSYTLPLSGATCRKRLAFTTLQPAPQPVLRDFAFYRGPPRYKRRPAMKRRPRKKKPSTRKPRPDIFPRELFKIPEVEGKTVESLELELHDDYMRIGLSFLDKTELRFDVQTGLTVLTAYADWKTGDWRGIKEWPVFRSTLLEP